MTTPDGENRGKASWISRGMDLVKPVFAVAILLSVPYAVVDGWWRIADLRAHGVEVTGQVSEVKRGGHQDLAILYLPAPGGGTEEVRVDAPGLAHVQAGNAMQVTYDPARPDVVQRGWGLDYASPILFTVLVLGLLALPAVVLWILFIGPHLPPLRRRRPDPPPPPRVWRPVPKRKRSKRHP